MKIEIIMVLMCLTITTQGENINFNAKSDPKETETDSANYLLHKNQSKDEIIESKENLNKIRIKRAKYTYPSKFYRLPPMVHPINGVFSVTPPSKYNREEYPNHTKQYKVNRPGNEDGFSSEEYSNHIKQYRVTRPQNEDGLANEDLVNIIKYLSQKDVNKLRDFIDEKSGYGPDFGNSRKREIYKEKLHDGRENSWRIEDTDALRYAGNYPQSKPYSNLPKINHISTPQSLSYVDTEKAEQELQMDFLNAQIFNEINNIAAYVDPMNKPGSNNVGIGTNNYENINYGTNNVGANNMGTYYPGTNNPRLNHYEPNNAYKNAFTPLDNAHENHEEILPKPENLREDHEGSFTNNVAKVAKPEYELKNFGELPLMDTRDSKLDSVSSYYVPHYTITSSSTKHRQPSNPPSNIPPVEYADSKSPEAGEGHLKAVKIWSHRSKGVAYTLHDDGTLSLEKKT